MTLKLSLPDGSGRMQVYLLQGCVPQVPGKSDGVQIPFNRVAFSAAHVVCDPLKPSDPWLSSPIDWDATLAYRRYLWSLGLGVAEAMDTAQRGMGLDWQTSLELIGRTLDASADVPGALVASGCGTDHLVISERTTLQDVIGAYEMQMGAIEKLGGRLILMASRALARVATSAEDYFYVYDRLLKQASQPVILHWLGDMFDPELKGYWGSHDIDEAMETVLSVIKANPAMVDGIKISLLDKDREMAMRRRLPGNVRMYTGDDFNYAELIDVEPQDPSLYSHALLGIFDAIAPCASAAPGRLAAGDSAGFHKILAPTVPLSRHIFCAPTRFYKTGVVFLAWLNGHQDHFSMVGGQQSARSLLHLAELFRLADAANVLINPELALRRMRHLLATYGLFE